MNRDDLICSVKTAIRSIGPEMRLNLFKSNFIDIAECLKSEAI